MSQDKCTIQVNGVEVEARPGQMLIEVTDAVDAYVPRFCYHTKLSVAANCRMCLVEVENAPKPMPACATPVAPGMKVHTRARRAIDAQRSTMEFLLINHPLDCPICDQGGECELQDLALGFGRDISRFSERKRVVRDKNIGPLISTDMTRCIHCTRCVRFTQEIAGFQELGTIGRGDRVEISPYIERSVKHELSGNIIDLCPVGALNSKPFRFSARAWEMQQRPLVAGHDGLGAHILAHVMNGKVKRVVPEACEDINETWASDRDRFSYEGLYATDRLVQPQLRGADGWRPVSWAEALDATAAGLQRVQGAGVAALVSPSVTIEEGYLLQRLLSHMGSANIDYRLRRRDFRDQEQDAEIPWLGMSVAEVEGLEQVLVIGSNIRKEVPLLAHRLRKAALRGAGVGFINPAPYPMLFPVADTMVGSTEDFWLQLAVLVRAAAAGAERQADLARLLDQAPAPEERHHQALARLRGAGRSAIFLGNIAMRHPRFAEIDALARALARFTGAALGYIPEGANAVGLALAGALPHREAGGRLRAQAGASAEKIIQAAPSGLILYGIEPEFDCAGGATLQRAAGDGRFVVSFSAFHGNSLQSLADVLLPIGTYFETDGTFVNFSGQWQSFAAAVQPPGETRPGWKVLRVLGERLGVARFDYAAADAIAAEVRTLAGELLPGELTRSRAAPGAAPRSTAIAGVDLDVPMYQVDALLRRASSLQQTDDGLMGVEAAEGRRTA